MFETMAAFVLQELLAQQTFLPPVGPLGDQRLLNPNNRLVATQDGFICFTINTDEQVKRFLTATDSANLIEDPRFAAVAARAMYVEEWFAVRGAPLSDKPTDEWLLLFRNVDIAAMPCHSLETLVEDPHLQCVQLLREEEHPVEGRTISIRPSLLVNGKRTEVAGVAAPKGWHTHEIRSEMGYDPTAIDAVEAEGAILRHTHTV